MDFELCHNISIIIESEKKKFYIARCEDMGISDYGDSQEEALINLRKALKLLRKYSSV